MYNFMVNSKWETSKINFGRTIHRRTALVMLIASMIVVSTGISEFLEDLPALNNYKWMQYANVPVFLCLFAMCEACFRLFRYREDPYPDMEKYPVITEQEFEAKVLAGENLSILDNMVLDLTDFAHTHPGGAFLIE